MSNMIPENDPRQRRVQMLVEEFYSTMDYQRFYTMTHGIPESLTNKPFDMPTATEVAKCHPKPEDPRCP